MTSQDAANTIAANPHQLRIPATAVTAIRTALLQEDGNERYAIAHCTLSNDSQQLLVERVVALPDTAHAISEPTACRPAPGPERDILTQCLEDDRHPLVLHSHPFAETADFSQHDMTMMDAYREWLQSLYPDTHLLFGVLGQQNLSTVLHTDDTSRETAFEPLPVDVIGDWTLATPLETRQPPTDPDPIDALRYDRNIRAYGEAAQHQLAEAHIAVIGCGGIGSYLAAGLARLGVGELTLVDPDEVEESNLPRLAGAQPGDVGFPKVRVVQEQCHRANPAIDITACSTPAQEADAHLQSVDLLVAGVDTVSARYWLNEFAVQHLIPYVDAGSVIDTDNDDAITAKETYIQTIAPGATACFDCLNRGDPEQARLEQLSDTELAAERERGYVTDTDLSPEPAVLPLNLHAVAHAIDSVVGVITGCESPPGLLRYDTVTQSFTPIETHPRPTCPSCSTTGVIGQGTASTIARTGTELATDEEITFLADEGGVSPTEFESGSTPLVDETTPALDAEHRYFPPAVTMYFTQQNHP